VGSIDSPACEVFGYLGEAVMIGDCLVHVVTESYTCCVAPWRQPWRRL